MLFFCSCSEPGDIGMFDANPVITPGMMFVDVFIPVLNNTVLESDRTLQVMFFAVNSLDGFQDDSTVNVTILAESKSRVLYNYVYKGSVTVMCAGYNQLPEIEIYFHSCIHTRNF